MTKRQRYPTDLTEKEWKYLQGLLPQKPTRPEQAREYSNAILCVLRRWFVANAAE